MPAIGLEDPSTIRLALVLPYVRNTRSLEVVFLLQNLRRVSSGEIEESLKVLIGPDAKSLSASTLFRLKKMWEQEYPSWYDEARRLIQVPTHHFVL
jgi:putative transposase